MRQNLISPSSIRGRNQKEMNRLITCFIFGFVIIFAGVAVGDSDAAVSSTGEINVQNDDQGRVPASSTVTLIVTLVIDRSLAEPGEEIKTIEITLPNGFIVEPSNIKSVSRDGQLVAVVAEIVGNALRIVLTNPITDFSNSINEIIFDSRTPATVAQEVTFRARLRNLQDQPIGEFIKPGNADGEPNNDDFTLQVIPNVPPEPVLGFVAESDLTGENDVTIRWQSSVDPDVNGYFIYRDNEAPINISDRSATAFRDVNVAPGEHVYAVEAYKTPLLRSRRSEAIRVVVREDTNPPKPPERLIVIGSGDGVRVVWSRNSSNRDVEKFQLFFGTSQGQLSPLVDGEVFAEPNRAEYEFTDDRLLGVGVFIYGVEAIDEAGNRSDQVTQTLRILGEPFPNPFTPLSDNPDFNRVVFPARAIEGGDGEFVVLIFNINGVLVRELKADPGVRELAWEGNDENGELVESGVYVYQIQLGESFKTGTVIVAK